MIDGGRPADLGAPFVAFVVFFTAQRVFELIVSARNARRLLARGGVERGRGHFPMFVVLHTLFPLALAAEIFAWGARPGPFAIGWLSLWAAAQLLRWAAMHALGERWNARVIVVPGEPPIRRGPYRWLRHPNYLAVIAEFLAAPLMFGAWRTAIVFSVLNLLALRVRVRCEERALAEAVLSAIGPRSANRNAPRTRA